jgi:serine/threonine protein kinase
MPVAAPLERGDPASLGRYEVIGRLGSGGQGAVYLGRMPAGERRTGGAPEYTYCAIKLLHAQMSADSSARARFAREVSAAQKVAPFCTARILEYDVHGDRPYIVSEYIDGPSLHDVVMRDGPLGAAELERLAIGTMTALAAIHESGIVHRDFKPNNVLLADEGPRVVDFGIARHLDTQESAVTATGMVVGTPGYLAPEQLSGQPLGPAVDIFAWGTTMVFAATGRSPFDADSLPVIINRILNQQPDLSVLPGVLRGLVERSLRKDPARRPTAIHLLQELLGHVGAAPGGDDGEALQEGTRIAAQPPPPPIAAPASAPPPITPPPITPPPITPPPTTPPPTTPPRTPPPRTPPPSPMPPPPPMPRAPSGYGPGTPPPMASPMPPGPRTPVPVPMGPPAPPPRAGYAPRPTRASSGTRGPVLAAVGCSVAFILIIVIAIVLAATARSGSDLPAPSDAASTSPTGTHTSTTTAITREYEGSWAGTGYQTRPRAAHWAVHIDLAAGRRYGTVRYPECAGLLRVVSNSVDGLVLRQTITTGRSNCAATGYVTLSKPGAASMRYAYADVADAPAPTATGTLYRQ